MRRREVTTATRGDRVPLRSQLRLPVALAVLTALTRLPYVDRPLSPDEGGFLLLAGQWSPGPSLYGHYWVDRPPLLIGLFGAADHLGGTIALRVLGMLAVAAAVVLAGILGKVAAPGRRRAAALTAATAAVFLSTPLFGTREVNGELLAVPFVLGGLVAVLRAVGVGRRAWAWWPAAGLLAVCATAVKQNMADVVVAGVVALAWQLRVRGLRRSAYDALAAAAGGLAAVVALVVWAETMGTEPKALWDAAVHFRFEAAAVISADDPGVTGERLRSMLHALALSGAPVLYLLPLLAVPRARERGCLPFVAVAVCLWEVVGVAAGGSYWWHYLVGLVPGLVLVVAALVRHRPGLQAPVAALLLYAALVGLEVDRQTDDVSGSLRENAAAADYLADHRRPGDTGVVAYGAPSILEQAGVRSPYEYLWSLPVRVRDPHLVELARVMDGPDRPTWMVVEGDTLDTWAIHPDTAQALLDTRYRLVAVVGRWRFFHVDDPVHSGRP
jgi:hypothetical protein